MAAPWPELHVHVGTPYTLVPTHVEDLRCTGVNDHGFAEFMGRIHQSDRAVLGSKLGHRKDLKVLAHAPGKPWHNEVVWEGYQEDSGPDEDDWPELMGLGGNVVLEETHLNILLRYDSPDVWGERDDEPYNQGENSPKYDVFVEKNLRFGIKAVNYVTGPVGDQMATIAHAGVCAQLEGAKIARIRYVLWKTLSTGSIKGQFYDFWGPNSPRRPVGIAVDLGGATPKFVANPQTRSCTPPFRDSIRLDLECKVAWNRKDLEDEKVVFRRPQLLGTLADGVSIPADTTNGRDVFIDLMNRVGFYTDSTLVPPLGTSVPVLPFWLQGDRPIGDAASDMAIYTGRVRNIFERHTNRQWKARLGDRGSSPYRQWRCDVSDIDGGPKKTTRGMANRIRVRYKLATERNPGRWRRVIVDATFDGTPDPFAGTDQALVGGNPVAFSMDLPDRQLDGDFATEVAKQLAREKRKPRWEGDFLVDSVTWRGGAQPFGAGISVGTEVPACFVREGDTVEVTNFHGPGQSQTFDVDGHETTDHGQGVYAGTEPWQSARWLAIAENAAERHARASEMV